jgi:hypothetical protein
MKKLSMLLKLRMLLGQITGAGIGVSAHMLIFDPTYTRHPLLAILAFAAAGALLAGQIMLADKA